jgi:hypothetical protein
MKKQTLLKGIIALSIVLCFITVATAQKPKPKPTAATQKPIIFAVLNDGSTLEPIAILGKKLTAPVNGSDDAAKVAAFDKLFYRKGATYRLIFGGANAGTVTVKSADAKAECSRNMAEVTTTGAKTPLKGLVMALATNAPAKSATAFRRKPTPAEKAEMDALAKAEFLKQKLTPKVLHYQNLTAVDVDNDGKPEFVASYWIEIDKLTRGLLFFIAQKGSSGKYSVGFREYRSVDQSKVMSGDIKNVDEGVYHELLLDTFDTDGDGTNEIFTYTQSFEGAGFNAYRRSGGKWVKAYEFDNYHCGY